MYGNIVLMMSIRIPLWRKYCVFTRTHLNVCTASK